MEEIYVNVEYPKHNNSKPSPGHTGTSGCDRSSHLGIIICLGMLSVFLLIGLITLGVYYHVSATNLSAESNKLSAITEERDLLNANLSAVSNKLSSMTEERDLLQANLTETTKELKNLQSLSKQKKVCPEGWIMFSHSCYVLSEKLGSWDEGRDDCRSKGADLVVIESLEDKAFISSYIKEYAWIGLNDKEEEGNWKWVDGTPLNLKNWMAKQPDNGGGNPKWGEEDCVQVETDASWNDLSCSASIKWICEKHTTE
ncbi:CD209 antigen-like protein C [Maylandia zebra]|uniref:CD209 antigen-like protein C n=1 Tax=Maylandia zebra TaxID=106582 RepID=UPI0006CECAFE